MVKHRTVKQEQEVVALSATHCRREIAEITGLSKTTVGTIQRKYHVVMRFGQSSSSSQFRHRYNEQAWGRVLEYLYCELELPLVEVAEVCKVSDQTVRHRMIELGIPRRESRESNRDVKRKGLLANELPRCDNGCGKGVAKLGRTTCSRCRRKNSKVITVC